MLREQLLGLPLFAGHLPALPPPRPCATCRTVFTPDRAHLVLKKYCCPDCWRVANNQKRREKAHQPEVRQVPLAPICHCGAPLTGVGIGWMGQTMEMCARGHETPIRRRVA